jgi:opacity protein-like surface antigen
MHRILPVPITLCLVLGLPQLFAQENKFEINGLIGYTLSEGVDVNRQEDDTLGVGRISPKSGFSFGLGMDYLINNNFSAGFNFGQENSVLRADVQNLEGVDITDVNVNNYHAILTYNFGRENQPLRPFIFGGLGATSYSPDSINGIPVEGFTKFSTTWGGGVKYFTSDHLGFKGGVRWTPTRIGSDSGGIWCSAYWPWSCWTPENANFSHQFEFNVGIVARF